MEGSTCASEMSLDIVLASGPFTEASYFNDHCHRKNIQDIEDSIFLYVETNVSEETEVLDQGAVVDTNCQVGRDTVDKSGVSRNVAGQIGGINFTQRFSSEMNKYIKNKFNAVQPACLDIAKNYFDASECNYTIEQDDYTYLFSSNYVDMTIKKPEPGLYNFQLNIKNELLKIVIHNEGGMPVKIGELQMCVYNDLCLKRVHIPDVNNFIIELYKILMSATSWINNHKTQILKNFVDKYGIDVRGINA